jgi:hypothetical protein
MNKLIILAIPLLIVLACFQNSYASTPYRSYEVTQIRNEGIVVRDFKGYFYLIEKDAGDIKVGDHIRYDSGRHRLRKSPWQLATITEMTDRTIKLKLNSGEKLEINTRSKYRRKFNQGDQVFYKKSSGQIKKSNFEKIGEE